MPLVNPDDVDFEGTSRLARFGQNIVPTTRRNPLTAGLSAGTDELQGMLYGAGGALADVAGADRAKQWLNERAALNAFEAQSNGRPDLERIEDQSLSSAAPYLGYQFAKQVPIFAGAIAATAVAPEAAVPAWAARAGAITPRVLGGGGFNAAASMAARREAMLAGRSLAADVMGATPYGAALGAGSMYNESVEAGLPDAKRALLMSPIYGALEAAGPAVAKGVMLRGSGLPGGMARRMATSGAVEAAGGATTELLQNEMEMSFNPNLSAEEKFSRRLNSAAMGGILEGGVGTLGGIRAPRAPKAVSNTDATDLLQPGQQGSLFGKAALATAPTAQGMDFEPGLAGQPSGHIGRQSELDLGFAPPAGPTRPSTFGGVTIQVPQDQGPAPGTLDYEAPQRFQPAQMPALSPEEELHASIEQFLGQGAGAPLPNIQDPSPGLAPQMARPMQGEMFADQEAVIPVQPRAPQAGPQVNVQSTQPGQQTLLDQRGQPTYAAEQSAGPDWQRAAQAVKMEFGIKSKGEKINALINTAVQARMEGRIDEADFTEFMSAVAQAPSRFGSHEKALKTITKETDHAADVSAVQEGPQGPLPAQAVQEVVQPQENPSEVQKPEGKQGNRNARPRATQQPTDQAGAEVQGAVQRRGQGKADVVRAGEVNAEIQSRGVDEGVAAQDQDTAGEREQRGEDRQSGGNGSVADGGERSGEKPARKKRKRRTAETAEVEAAVERLNEAKDAGVYRNALVYLMDAAENSRDQSARDAAQQELDQQPKNNDDWKAAEKKYARLKKFTAEIQSDNAEQPKFSKGESTGTTEAAIRAQITALTGEDTHWKVTVFPTLEAAQAHDLTKSVNADGKTQAFVVGDHAYFIASNINPGSEQAVFLHEVGAHMGLEKTLTPAQFNALAGKIEEWAARNDGSQESTLAKAALERAEGDQSEMIAYFIEEAVDAGINPTANTVSSEIARWFNTLWSAFKGALAKLGINPEALTAQDVVDLAYGAAHAELNAPAPAPLADAKMVQVQTATGIPAFRNDKVALANPKLVTSDRDGTKQVVYDILNVPKLREAKAKGTPPARSKVGQLLVNMKDGQFVSFRNIEINPSQQSKGYGTSVLEALLATNAPGTEMQVWDILPSARKWWDDRGVKRNFSDLDMVVGTLNTEQYQAKRGTQNDSQVQPAQDAQVRRSQAATSRQGGDVQQAGRDAGRVGRDNEAAGRANAAGKGSDASHKLLDWASDLAGDHGRQLTREFMTLRQLAAAFGDKFSAVKKYAESALAMGATAEHAMLGYAKVQQAILSLPKIQQDRLFDLMTQSTLDDVHPNVPLSDKLNEHAAGKQGAMERWVKLNAQWNALDSKAQAAYIAARDEFKANWQKRLDLIDAKMTKLLPEADLARWKEERARWARQLQGPYFPLMRFGRWVTVWKSPAYLEAEAENNTKALHDLKGKPEHYSVEFNDSKTAAERLADSLRGKGGKAYTVMHNEYENEAIGLNKGFVDKLEEALALQFKGKEGSEAVATLKELYARALPDYNAMKRTLQRRGVHGVKAADMMRSLSRAGMADAYYLARLEHADELTDALHDLKGQDTQDNGGDGSLYSLMLKRHSASMKRVDTPIQNFLTNLTYVNMLGSSPAFMLINGLQPWMVTLPMLGARHGFRAGAKALATATADAGRILKTNFSEQGWRFELNFDPVKGSDPLNLKTDEREMLKGLLDSGLIDITIAHDLASMAYGGNAKYNTAMKLATTAPQYVEVVNRIATALAAYRLEKSKSGQASAQKYAEKAVAETQLDYSSVNTPYRMMPGVTPMARVLFQFRKYQQGMIWLLANNFGKALKGDKEARNMMFGLLATHGSMAGVAGLPVAFPVAILAKIVAQAWDDDDEPDPEAMWRNFLADTFGVEAGRVIQKGLPAALGIDLSGRVGLGNVFNPLPQMEFRGTLSDTWKDMLAGSISPTVANLGNYVKATEAFTKGEWGRGLEYSLPKMFADPLKAMRFANEGVTTKAGNVALTPDDVTGWDAALRALGLTSTKFSEYYDAKSIVENANKRTLDARNDLIGQYVKARRAGDQDKLNEIQSEVGEFNSRHPDGKAQRITMSTLLQAWNSREKYTAQTNDAGIRVKKGENWKTDLSRFASM